MATFYLTSAHHQTQKNPNPFRDG